MTAPNYITLHGGETSLILDATIGVRPSVLYWGSRLNDADPATLKRMAARQHAPGSPDVEQAASLLNETGSGVGGFPGFAAHRRGADWCSLFKVSEIKADGSKSVEIVCEDRNTALRASHYLSLDPISGVLCCQTEIENQGSAALSLDWCAAMCLPLDQQFEQLKGFTGRWANEFQVEDIPAFTGAYVRENRAGRTSHDSFPGLIAQT